MICLYAKFEASRGAVAQSVTVKPTGCGFELEEMKYLLKCIFPFLRSGVETRNASRIRQKVGNGVS